LGLTTQVTELGSGGVTPIIVRAPTLLRLSGLHMTGRTVRVAAVGESLGVGLADPGFELR
jgi:hypothetical protein